MLACVGVTLGFKTAEKIGNAYGTAVVLVMTLTSILLVIVMIVIWKLNIFFIISYVLIIGSIELIYLSAAMYKFDQGGYLPLAFSAVLMTIMYVWNNVYRRKYYYEHENQVSPQMLKEIATDTSLCRIPGLVMFYSEFIHGVPPIFNQYVANVKALHSIIVFVSMESLPVSKVPSEERFIFHRVEPRELNIFCCVTRYGYTGVPHKDGSLESLLVEKLKEFIIGDYGSSQMITNGGEIPVASIGNLGNKDIIQDEMIEESLMEREIEAVEKAMQTCVGEIPETGIESLAEDILQEGMIEESQMEREIETVEKAWQAGVVQLIGETELIAAEGAGIASRVMINYVYNFMKRNLRQFDEVYNHIPHKKMLKVRMTYEL